jgi:DNA-binding NarL/FixJ family response regulator
LKGGDPGAPRCIEDFIGHAFKRGALDLLVTAYRSTPELLGVLLAGAPPRERVGRLVSRVGDEDLAAAVGQPLALDDRRELLSPREHEVLRYLENGLTNSQIAAALFIAESTVKVHVHHIFDKLGVRSRADLAMRARLRGFDQATSATTGGDATGGPSLL